MVLAGLGVRIRYLKPILQGERKRPVHGAAGRPPPERAPSERARDLGSGREQQATVLGLASAPRPLTPGRVRPAQLLVPRPAIKTGGDLNKTSPGALLDATDQFSPFAPTDLLWRGLRHNPRCYTLSPAPSTGAEPSKTPPPLQGLFKSHLFQEVNPNCLSQKGRLFF